MHFSVSRASLFLACSMTRGVGLNRNRIPIIDNILIEAGDDALTITSNNLDMSVTVTVPAIVKEKGVTTANMAKITDIVSVAPEGSEFDFRQTEGDRLKLRVGRSNYTLSTLPASDFPLFADDLESLVNFSIRGAELERMFSIIYAVNNTDDAPYLNGIFLHRHEDLLKAVATNKYNLAVVEMPLPEGAEGLENFDENNALKSGIIIHPATVKMLLQLISDGEVEIAFDNRRLDATIERDSIAIRFKSKLLDATYPAYRRIIPDMEELVGPVTVETERLESAIKRVAIMGSNVVLNFAGNSLRISAADRQLGEDAADVIDIDWPHGETSINFNSKTLMLAIKGLDTKEIRFGIGAKAGYNTRPSRFECRADASRFDLVTSLLTASGA